MAFRQHLLPCQGLMRFKQPCTQRKQNCFIFVAKGDGSHQFSKTLAEHNAAVRKISTWEKSSMSAGKFIVVEGMEGAGKSSAIDVVCQTLKQQGIHYINTREPGGTPLAEKLRSLVKSVDHDEKITQQQTELFLMYAARSQLVANIIKPALAQGTWVVGDRHDMSSQAYQGGGRGISQATMHAMADITLAGFKPDLTLYLDIDPKIGLSRARARGALDRIELEQFDFFERVHQKYNELAQADETVTTIDAQMPMDKVHVEVAAIVQSFCQKS